MIMQIGLAALIVWLRKGTNVKEILEAVLFVERRLYAEMEFWIKEKNVTMGTNPAAVLTAKSMRDTNAPQLWVRRRSAAFVATASSKLAKNATTKTASGVLRTAKSTLDSPAEDSPLLFVSETTQFAVTE